MKMFFNSFSLLLMCVGRSCVLVIVVLFGFCVQVFVLIYQS